MQVLKKTKLSRNTREFGLKENNEQVAELSLRMSRLTDDLKKFSILLNQKYFLDNYKREDLKLADKSAELKELINKADNSLRELIPYMGQYKFEGDY